MADNALRTGSNTHFDMRDEETIRSILEILVNPEVPDTWEGEESICRTLEHHPAFLSVPEVCTTYALSSDAPLPLMKRTARVLALLAGRLSRRFHLLASTDEPLLFSGKQLQEIRGAFEITERTLFRILRSERSYLLQVGQQEPQILSAIARLQILTCLFSYPIRTLSFEDRLKLIERLVVSTNRKIFKERFSEQFYEKISRGTPLSADDKKLLSQRKKVYRRIRYYGEILAKAYVVQAFKKNKSE